MNARGFVVMPDQGLLWNMAPGRSAVLKLLSEETAESVMMFEETVPTGRQTSIQLHHDSDEVAYVLRGEITFKIGDQVTVGGPGTCAFIPRGTGHAWKNTGTEAARVLFLYTPARAGKMFEEASRLQRPVAAIDRDEAAELMRRHGTETIGPPPF
jgi:quercetin dioxygenase-like cupin family protein